MENKNVKKARVIRIPESKLVNIIEGIVKTAVKEEKTKWITESKKTKKTITSKEIDTLVENKVMAILAKKFGK